MTKMQIWSKETPRRSLRKKSKKKASLLEAPRQLPLHSHLFPSFSQTRTHRLAFLLYSLSRLRHSPFLILADPTLVCPGHLPPLDLNPIYLSTAETLRIFAWLAHSNFLADAWTPRRSFWALVLSKLRNLGISHIRFLLTRSWLCRNNFFDL